MRKYVISSICIVLIAAIISTFVIMIAVEKSKDIKFGEKFSVNFCDENGKIVETIQTRKGFVKPPQALDLGYSKMFKEWYPSVLDIEAETDIKPVVQDIEGINTVFIDTNYVPRQKSFDISVKLGGVVECNKLEFYVNYEPNVLEYKGFAENIDGVTVEKSGESSIKVKLERAENLTEGITLLQLTFKSKIDDYIYTTIDAEFIDIEKNVNGVSVNTDCSLYDGLIYTY